MPNQTDGLLKPSEQIITLKHGSTFTAPSSWKTKSSKDFLAMLSPEADISVYFLERPIDGDLKQMAREVWRELKAEFDYPMSQDLSLPISEGWEKTYHWVYDTPSSDSHFLATLLHVYKGMAYLCLIDATLSGLSRRMAEVSLMQGSWLPAGFKARELNNDPIKNWGELEVSAFEQFVGDAMQKLNVPGIAVAIVRQDGHMFYKKGFGVKRVGCDRPVTTDTPFMIGSTTKSLTTLLMSRLIDAKQLSWETPVKAVLPQFCLADDYLTEHLTIRHTVSASTGMPRRDLDWIFKYKGVSPEERLSQMKGMKPTTALGETFQYSNYLVMAGGYAAARAYTSKGNLEHAYALAMQDLVFNPLHMTKTVIKAADAQALDAAFPHAVDFSAKLCDLPLDWEEAIYSVAPAGAIWSTVEDLSQYLLVEMNKGVLKGQRIVSEDSLMERRKPGIKMGAKMFYGLGLYMVHEQGFNIVGHGGATIGFSSDLFFLPEKGIGMTILANARAAHALLYAIRQKFLELSFAATRCSEDTIAFAIRQQEELRQKNQKNATLLSENTMYLEGLVGSYSNDSLGRIQLTKTTHGQGYEMVLDEWATRIGLDIEANGKKVLVLMEGPLAGMIKLLVGDDGRTLTLDAGQDRYDFTRTRDKNG